MAATSRRECLTCARVECECVDLSEYELHKVGKVLTVNAERAANRWVRAEFVKEWRTEFGWRSTSIPPLAWFSILAIPYQSRGRLQDVGACLPAVKAAVDGLVDRGVVPDDDSRYVRSVIFHPPQRGENGLTIRVRGPKG